MHPMLVAIPWWGTVSGPLDVTLSLIQAAVALALTAGVAILAGRHRKKKARGTH